MAQTRRQRNSTPPSAATPRRRRLRPQKPRKAPHRKRSRKHLARSPGTMVVREGAIYWKLPRRLRSLNSLKTGIARYGDTQAWEAHLARALELENDLSLGPGTARRMRLEVQRLSPSRRYFLDQTNLAGGAKGLEDALVRLGYLHDDTSEWEDGPHVSQALSDDKRYWTIVKLTEAPVIEREEDAKQLWPPQLKAA